MPAQDYWETLFDVPRILDAFGIQSGEVVRRWPNLLASVAVFKFERG